MFGNTVSRSASIRTPPLPAPKSRQPQTMLLWNIIVKPSCRLCRSNGMGEGSPLITKASRGERSKCPAELIGWTTAKHILPPVPKYALFMNSERHGVNVVKRHKGDRKSALASSNGSAVASASRISIDGQLAGSSDIEGKHQCRRSDARSLRCRVRRLHRILVHRTSVSGGKSWRN